MGRTQTAEAEQTPTFQPAKVSLYVRSGSRDAIYNMQLTQSEAGWNVRAQYGRNGSTLSLAEKATNVTYEKAKTIFDKTLKAKLTENPPYRYADASPEDHAIEPDEDDESNRMNVTEPKRPVSVGLPDAYSLPLFSCELLTRVEPANAMPYVKHSRYWFQTKRDDRRFIAIFRNGEYFGLNKKGERVGMDPELRDGMARIVAAGKLTSLMLDSEIEASGLWMWDLLDANGEQVRELAYSVRFGMLELLVASLPADLAKLFHIVETAKFAADKLDLWQRLELARAEGFVIKDSTARYRAGRNGQHLKCKFEKMGSVIVGPKPKKDDHRSVAMFCFVAPGRPLRYMGTVGVPDKYPLPADGSMIDVRYLYRHHGIEGKLMQAKYFGKLRDDLHREDCIVDQFRLKQTDEEAGA